MLHGRADEVRQVERTLDSARAGQAAGLLVVGDAGTGKSALLDLAAQHASDFLRLAMEGVESETELAGAGLSDLVRPCLDRLPDLPGQARRAIESATGRSDEPVGPLAVGAAVLSLLTLLAEDGPVLCQVDDAHWVDPASLDAVRFATRRLDRERVAVLVAARDGEIPDQFGPAVSQLALGPLTDAAARQLLQDTGLRRPVDVDHVVRAAEGNPLALVELSRAGADHPAGSAGSAAGLVQKRFLAEVAGLPRATRLALVVLAACDSVDEAFVQAAVTAATGDPTALDPGYGTVLRGDPDGGPRFRHPLLRAAVYDAALPPERRLAHEALAAAAVRQPERRAWHRALAATGPDDAVADELVRTASSARRRGGHHAEAMALDRAGRLCTSPDRAARLWLESASAAVLAGAHDWARQLLDRADRTSDDLLLAADVAYEKARLSQWQDSVELPGLLDLAHRVAAADPGRAARLASYGIVPRLAELDAAGLIPLAAETEVLLGGSVRPLTASFKLAYARVALGETETGAALAAEAAKPAMAAGHGTALTQLGNLHAWLERYDAALSLLDEAVEVCRRSGATWMLVNALVYRAGVHRRTGRLLVAAADLTEAQDLSHQVSVPLQRADVASALAQLDADRGRLVEARAHAQDVLRTAGAMRSGGPELEVAAGSALAMAELTVGRYEDAAARLERVAGRFRDGGFAELGACPGVVELVEAYARTGRADAARSWADEVEAFAAPRRRGGLLAAAARGRALLDPDGGAAFERAAGLARDAGEALGSARAMLYLGEWLRRERRVREARPVLADAHGALDVLGAHGWADRAAAELRATGARAPEGGHGRVHELTPQELQIALLAGGGARNREIAEQLYLSEKTVEAHLGRVFRKLQVRSRTQLAGLLGPANP